MLWLTPVIYFYLWVIVIVGSILAVPIMAFVEKSKQKKLRGPEPATQPEEAIVDDGLAMPAAAVGATAAAVATEEEFGAFPAGGGEDFSAFEDFK